MAVEQIELDLIEDNPYQSRLTYHRGDIDDLAASIKANGLLQVPLARRKDGQVQLGIGHLRKRAFVKLAKDGPEWTKMPLDIRELSDEQMAVFALEENLKRRDITPIEVARAVGKYLDSFIDKTENDLAKLLNMTQGNISNMRRVLKLPAKVLEKVDEGRISFTMGRELLVFQGFNAGKTLEWSRSKKTMGDKPVDDEYLMLEAIRNIDTPGTRQYGGGHPCTVDGMHKAIHSTASNHFGTLDRTHDGPSWYYRDSILFDAKETGCFKCDKMIRTHPTKSGIAHWCTDKKCWEKHQQEHKDKVATAAKAKMEEDILRAVAEAEARRAEDISQEIPADVEAQAKAPAKDMDQALEYWREQFGTSFELVYPGLTKHIAQLCGRCTHRADCSPWPQRLATAQGEFLECLVDDRKVGITPGHQLCLACWNRYQCDGTNVHVGDDGNTLVCDERMVGEKEAEKVRKHATKEVPQELRSLAMEKAGTRAEVLDLREIRLGHYGELKQGYARLERGTLEIVDDAQECLERCTTGFHYAFDSDPSPWRRDEGQVNYVCTNTKCLAKKKAAFTRAVNAAGQAKKKAEMAAIKQAVGETTSLDRARMKLVLLAFMEAGSSYYYYEKNDAATIATRLNLNTKTESGSSTPREKLRAAIFEAVDKLSDQDMAKLIVDHSLLKLTYDGELGAYKVQTTEPLNWMGIGINLEKKEAKA